MTQINGLADYHSKLTSWVIALDKRRDALSEYLLKLQQKYPSWRAGVNISVQNTDQFDARPEYFMLLAVILQNAWLSFTHMRDQLCDRSYWAYVEPKFTSDQHLLEAISGYSTMVNQYAISQTVSITQTCLTAIVNSAPDTFSSAATIEFKNLYSHVLRNLSLSHRYEELFDIIRLVRNTNHTNGFFQPRLVGNLVKTYGGKEYQFKVGQSIKWYSDDMIISLFEWMPDAMWEIVTTPQVSGISEALLASVRTDQ